jgi:hypothetical protein
VAGGLTQKPQNSEQEDLRGEAVPHTGDGVVERVMKFVNWLHKCRFPFEKITGSFEKIWEKAEEGAPNGRSDKGEGRREKREVGRIESQNDNAGENEIDDAMNHS